MKRGPCPGRPDRAEPLADPTRSGVMPPVEAALGVAMNRRWWIALVIVMLAALVPSSVLGDEPECTIFGTDGDDAVPSVPAGEVYCGLGGNDLVGSLAGTFIGGPGADRVMQLHSSGTFYGGPGNDIIIGPYSNQEVTSWGTFFGGPGNDRIHGENRGLFEGGPGHDHVSYNHGTFYGGGDGDLASSNYGTFYGGAGDDIVGNNYGTFHGGAGDDTVGNNWGTFIEGGGEK
jgi:hypothetical protein